jgi:hypothetical protein
MKIWAMFVVGALCGVVVAAVTPKVAMRLHAAVRGGLGHGGTNSNVAEMRVHSKETFAFTANGVMEEVVPLFGADKERVGAGVESAVCVSGAGEGCGRNGVQRGAWTPARGVGVHGIRFGKRASAVCVCDSGGVADGDYVEDEAGGEAD